MLRGVTPSAVGVAEHGGVDQLPGAGSEPRLQDRGGVAAFPGDALHEQLVALIVADA